MADQDLHEEDGIADSDLDEEVVEGTLEEPSDESEEIEGFEDEEGGLGEDSDPLDQFPEEYRDLALKFSEKRVGKVQSQWQQKLDEAAELRKQAEVVQKFNERFTEDPHGLIAELQKMAPEKQQGPEDPGPMPDPQMDPDEWREWYEKDKAYQSYMIGQQFHEQQADLTQAVQGIQAANQQQAQKAQMSALQAQYGFDDAEMQEFLAEMQRVRQDTDYALKTLADRVKGRKAKVQTKKKRAAAVREAVQGEEERPGLPAEGVHAKPTPTGNVAQDVLAELKAEGKVPPGIFD